MIVPDHRELARRTLASILRQAGVVVDELLDLLWAVLRSESLCVSGTKNASVGGVVVAGIGSDAEFTWVGCRDVAYFRGEDGGTLAR